MSSTSLPPSACIKVLEAGVDQFGGEALPRAADRARARAARSAEERLDVSARRLLREKFVLGLFENPYVDADAADAIVGSAEFRAAGEAAQRASITVLSNGWRAAPSRAGATLYVEGIAAEVAGTSTASRRRSPAEADVAILRLQAPYEQREYDVRELLPRRIARLPGDTIAHVREVAASVPTVVDVFLDRPAILAPIAGVGDAVVANWGAGAAALLDVLSGGAPAPRAGCRSTSRARWQRSRHRAPTCRSTRRTRCSASGTA